MGDRDGTTSLLRQNRITARAHDWVQRLGLRVIRVLIVAEARIRRDSLALSLKDNQRLRVHAVPTRDARVAARDADVALVDLPVEEGRRLAPLLLREAPNLRMIALGVDDREEEVVAWAEVGIAGYSTTEDSLDRLRAAIFSVARGETLCSPRMTAALLRRVATLAAAASAPDNVDGTLTRRESEVADLIAAGLSNKEIGQSLSIEVATVKNHVHSILGKLDVERRAQAAIRIAANGGHQRA
jgi:two-component system nitrate/nitrite response regulator NarL